jgi:predicted RNA polymerase sigma factor
MIRRLRPVVPGNNHAAPVAELARLAERESFSRLVAYLAAITRDAALAEELIGDALGTALETWPHLGSPRDPTAWLLKAAQRRFVDLLRHQRVEARVATDLADWFARNALSVESEMIAAEDIPDKRLELLFVCAHPAIDEAVRAPLMLQVVFGFDAGRVGALFLTAAKTMGQRLTRAKLKIREAGISYRVPEPDELAPRTAVVLDALYAAYTAVAHTSHRSEHGVLEDVLWLVRLVVDLLPHDAEAKGLLALLLHIEARRPSAAQERFVPLSERDAREWCLSKIDAADELLGFAASQHEFGRYQLEAAIQSAHNARARGLDVPWSEVLLLYRELNEGWPSLGAAVARAAATLQSGDAGAALALLDEVARSIPQHGQYQPYWATRAAVLRELQRQEDAETAYRRAAALTEDSDLREFLLAKTAPRH